MARILAIRGWEKFQHYKDRDPPWVKLYRDLMTAESWVLGSDCSRLVQVASILLAARYTNQIPLNWPLIRKVASLDCTEKAFLEAIDHLNRTEWLEVIDIIEAEQVASTLLADCAKQNLRLYSEAEQSRAEQSRGKGRAAPVIQHESLPNETWEEWLAFRREKRWPLSPTVLRKQLGILAPFDTETQRRMIDNSIQSEWQGLFPLKGNGASRPTALIRLRTPEEIRIEEDARAEH